MDKHIFMLHKPREMSYGDFTDFVMNDLCADLAVKKPAKLFLSLSIEHAPRLTVLPLKRNGFALISITGDFAGLYQLLQHRAGEKNCVLWSYHVKESPYVEKDHYWENGEEVPGLTLVTIFRKKKGLSPERFKEIWFGEHSPLAITIHPLYRYIRNVVMSTYDEVTPDFDAIVEEHFIQKSFILNPVKMFGGWLRFLPNMVRIFRHVNTFIDLETLENYLCKEYHLIG